jgi:hypothetical protein
MRTLLETYKLILESRQTEEDAVRILKNANFSDEDIQNAVNKLKEIDKSNNQKNLPMMATVLSWGFNNYNVIENDFNNYNDLLKKGRIKTMIVAKNTIRIGEIVFNDYLKLQEFIDGEITKIGKKVEYSSQEDFTAEDTPIQSSNGIDVYKADNVGKCIKYSQGNLTGRGYSFCIGNPNPSNNMYQSYRDMKDSTFYYVVDRNRFITNDDGSVNLDDPLHLVVYDATKYGVELTDENNTTGNIAEFGKDVAAYQKYLSSKGINVNELKNNPKTPKEKQEQELLGNQNLSLEWFKKLSFEYKSKYIGRGHLLSDEQFNYLLGNE